MTTASVHSRRCPLQAAFPGLMMLLALSYPVWGEAVPSLPLIPWPERVTPGDGACTLTATTRIRVDGTVPGADAVAGLLAALLRPATGHPFPVSTRNDGEAVEEGILLTAQGADPALGDEGYELIVTGRMVTIRAPKPAGMLYGVQTLRQLLPIPIERRMPVAGTAWTIPAVAIVDRPRFPWRGLMLDVSRTFFGIDCLKRYIDLLALYKMNVLHLHLTDDQGWRLEIRTHPRLTTVGAVFAGRFHEPGERQGFYSQAEIRALVAYAAARNVTVVPEIEMPGHCLAVLAAYPELSCTGEAVEVHPFSAGPGIHKEVFCAGNDRVFALLEDVLTEVFELFPSPWIHIGGDECPKDRWKACAKCQARKHAEGLKDEHGLQSYFIKRMARFIEGRGRKVIGWDEILEGGLAENAAVMSWRGTAGGIAAADMGHGVVMSPTSHCYFDYDNRLYPARKVYAYEPVPSGLVPERARSILGAQANFWSHIDRTEPRMDRQIFPRLPALAEVVWSPRTSRSWEGFAPRLDLQTARLALLGTAVHRDLPDPPPRLAVAPDGAVWFLGDAQDLLVRRGGVWSPQVGKVRQVALGPDGTIWAVGMRAVPGGGHELLRSTASGWTSLGAKVAATHIAVASDGALWAVNGQRLFVLHDGTWKAVAGEVNRIATGADGSVYGLGVDMESHGRHVQRFAGGTWQEVAGAVAVQVAVSSDGALWTMDAEGRVRVLREGIWREVPGRVQQIAAGPDRQVYALAGDGALWQWNGTAWQDLGRPAP